jgi:adenosylcobinamide-phosphate synthase
VIAVLWDSSLLGHSNWTRLDLAIAVCLDLALGDPRWFPHPIRGFGWIVRKLETLWRSTGLPLRLSGVLFWINAVSIAGILVWITLPWASIFWIYTLLALRSLDVESALVMRHLERSDLAAARASLAMIVGRDTAHLNETEIVRAVVETVSENLSDGVIAPLFYLALGGPAAMAAYKAINTLDSMVGYRNDRYREFGWASARLDDLANFLPARLTALLVAAAAPLVGLRGGRALRIAWRDGGSQPSPNAGYPEAAFAGALGVRLGGLNFYGGKPSPKATLGDPVRTLDRAAYRDSRRLLYAASAIAIGVLLCL